MGHIITRKNRRGFLSTLTLGATAFATRGLFADELVRTPKQTEGPFYPDKLPLDTDNDLLVINDTITPAVGEVTHLTGRILDAKGNPVRNALVEIWQVDNNGVYIHTKDPHRSRPRRALPGFWSIPDRVHRRVLLPHHQAGPLSRGGRATSISRSAAAAKSCSRPSATSRVSRRMKRTSSTRASATARLAIP